MKALINIFLLLLIVFATNCKNKKKKVPFELYFKMDIHQGVEKQLNPKTTVTIPFSYNQIYDPFLSTKKKKNNQKSGFKKGSTAELKIHVLDTVESEMNIQIRKKKQPNFVKAYPVIIENKAKLSSMYLPLHRGCAVIIQQIKTTKNKWIDIENQTKEKLGDFYYQIKPKQYIYTKTPIYSGNDSVELRIKLVVGDSNYFSNSYKSTVPKWIKRKE